MANRGPDPMSADDYRRKYADMISAYVDDGLSLRAVGALFGVSFERVRQVLSRAGIETRPRHRLSPALIKEND